MHASPGRVVCVGLFQRNPHSHPRQGPIQHTESPTIENVILSFLKYQVSILELELSGRLCTKLAVTSLLSSRSPCLYRYNNNILLIYLSSKKKRQIVPLTKNIRTKFGAKKITGWTVNRGPWVYCGRRWVTWSIQDTRFISTTAWLPTKRRREIVIASLAKAKHLCFSGRTWWRERGELPFLPKTLHGSVAKRSQIHSDDRRHEEVSTPPRFLSIWSQGISHRTLLNKEKRRFFQ